MSTHEGTMKPKDGSKMEENGNKKYNYYGANRS